MKKDGKILEKYSVKNCKIEFNFLKSTFLYFPCVECRFYVFLLVGGFLLYLCLGPEERFLSEGARVVEGLIFIRTWSVKKSVYSRLKIFYALQIFDIDPPSSALPIYMPYVGTKRISGKNEISSLMNNERIL